MTRITIEIAQRGGSASPDPPRFRPGERIGGHVVLSSPATAGELMVELRNLEAGGLVRDEATIRAETAIAVGAGGTSIPFDIAVPVDAVPGFVTDVQGDAADGLGPVVRTWALHARYGAEESTRPVEILPAAPDVPAEALVTPDFAVPQLSINGPPGRMSVVLAVALPALAFAALAAGAALGAFAAYWLVIPGLALLAGGAVAAALAVERRSQHNLDYGRTTITLDRKVYRRGDRISASIRVDTSLPVHAVLELVEVRPVRRRHMVDRAWKYVDNDVTFTMWTAAPVALKQGTNDVSWTAPADQPSSYRGSRTGLAWMVQVLADSDAIHTHFPRAVVVIRP